MSANNYLRIWKPDTRNVYLLDACDADTHTRYERIGEYPELEEAIKRANEYMEEDEVEYGLTIDIK